MLNGITDINKFVQDCFKQGFDIERFGLLGKTPNDGEKDLIKEVIIEKRVEIPVEVIKEVEKIVEVPVEKVVEVIKEVEKSSDKTKLLEGTLQNLKKELNLKDEKINQLTNKIKELENLKINTGAVFMKGSNLTQNL